MKRINLLLVAIGLIFSVQTFAQIHIGVKAGGNVCKMKFDVDNDYGGEPDIKAKMGFHLGLITDIPLMENTLSLQPGLLFSNKGFSFDMKEMLDDEFDDLGIDMDDYKGYVRMNYNYIELPLNLVYKNSGFQVFAGPYFGLGLGGSFKHDYSFEANGEDFDSNDFYDNDSYTLKPVIGEVDDDMYEDYLDDEDVLDLYRAFDFGLNLGVGYQIKEVLFNIGYSYGLTNLTPKYNADGYEIDEDYTENVIQKNRVLTFSVSYFFN
jgi:hypothetical protein